MCRHFSHVTGQFEAFAERSAWHTGQHTTSQKHDIQEESVSKSMNQCERTHGGDL